MNNNIEDLIESKIDNIIKEKNIYHVGKVVRINSFVIEATGLEDAFFFEKVYIGSEDNVGYVDKIEENKVIIALVKTNGEIKIGDLIKTTGEALQAGFSKNAIGMIVDAFGTDRMTGKNFNESKQIPIETEKIPIMDRTAVNRPLETGISSIDLMFPIGKGQRQLIIGDKKTGKTQILLDTIVNQKGKDVICIYVSIGKTKKEIKRLYTKLIEKGASTYTQIVAAFNDDTSPLIKLTPYVGLSIAEEYMKEGKDVLVCIDDLKKHADACREIALIAEKNTGREAYPADIFYIHSRLLEKGCQYKNGGSITVLPVVETKGGDITDYVSTNIISITDGQIVLSDKNFKKGQKPALDFGLSVSRLGGAVQKDSIKKVGAAVRRELLSYLETADVYQLVKIDSMSKELQEKIFRGKKLLELLNQPKFAPRSEEKLLNNFSFILDEHALGENIKTDEQLAAEGEQPVEEAPVQSSVPQTIQEVVVEEENTNINVPQTIQEVQVQDSNYYEQQVNTPQTIQSIEVPEEQEYQPETEVPQNVEYEETSIEIGTPYKETVSVQEIEQPIVEEQVQEYQPETEVPQSVEYEETSIEIGTPYKETVSVQEIEQPIVEEQVQEYQPETEVPQNIIYPEEQPVTDFTTLGLEQQVVEPTQQFTPVVVPVETTEDIQIGNSHQLPMDIPQITTSIAAEKESQPIDDEDYYDTEVLDLTQTMKPVEPQVEEPIEEPMLIPLGIVEPQYTPQAQNQDNEVE